MQVLSYTNTHTQNPTNTLVIPVVSLTSGEGEKVYEKKRTVERIDLNFGGLRRQRLPISWFSEGARELVCGARDQGQGLTTSVAFYPLETLDAGYHELEEENEKRTALERDTEAGEEAAAEGGGDDEDDDDEGGGGGGGGMVAWRSWVLAAVILVQGTVPLLTR